METLCLSSAALGVGLLRSEKVAVECSVLLSMMVNILRTMARSSPGGTSDSQLGGWPVTPLNRETVSLLDNSEFRQVLQACLELLCCTICPLCAPVVPFTAVQLNRSLSTPSVEAKCCYSSLSSPKAEICCFSSVVYLEC